MNVDPRLAVKRVHKSPGKQPAAKKKLQTAPTDKGKKVARELDKEFIKHKKQGDKEKG